MAPNKEVLKNLQMGKDDDLSTTYTNIGHSGAIDHIVPE
jgi:hypothetical protein